jgi:hypothetical protein
MKKALILSWLPFLLFGCRKASVSASLTDDEATLSAKADSAFVTDVSAYFSVLTSLKTGTDDSGKSVYYYRFTLGGVKEEQHDVRVLLLASGNYFFFGYDGSYTLTLESGSTDAAKKVYKALAVNFSLTEEAKTIKVSYVSKEVSPLYFVTSA